MTPFSAAPATTASSATNTGHGGASTDRDVLYGGTGNDTLVSADRLDTPLWGDDNDTSWEARG
jgi:hypothetical protein